MLSNLLFIFMLMMMSFMLKSIVLLIYFQCLNLNIT